MQIDLMMLLLCALSLLGLVVIFFIGLGVRRLGSSPEVSRKTIHILTTLAIASWPFYLDQPYILILLSVGLAVAILQTRWPWLQQFGHVNRKSYGEIFGAISLLMVAAAAPQGGYLLPVVAINMGLVDAAASLVGKRFGRHKFKVFGALKSLEGSLAALLTAIVIALAVIVVVDPLLPEAGLVLFVFASGLSLTIAELLGARGADNLLIPLVAAILYGGLV